MKTSRMRRVPMAAIGLLSLSLSLSFGTQMCVVAQDTVDTTPPTAMPSAPPTVTPVSPPTSPPTAAPITDMPTLAPITEMPTRQPTNAPVTNQPSATPTQRPSNVPTATPTSTPTRLPTAMPVTANPTAIPTSVPSAMPTAKPVTSSPTQMPTDTPVTSLPTSAPSESPSDLPSNSPSTSSPTAMPSVGPTAVEPTTSLPTTIPTSGPTLMPSTAPSDLPSSSPSSMPSKPPTSAPSSLPSVAPSSSPSDMPSSIPTRSFESAEVESLEISLLGVSQTSLDEATKVALQSSIAAHTETYFDTNPQLGVEDMTSTVTILDRRRFLRNSNIDNKNDSNRQLQDTAFLKVVYEQTFKFRFIEGSDPSGVDGRFLSTTPFADASDREVFQQVLANSGNTLLETVSSVTNVAFPFTNPPTISPTLMPTGPPVDATAVPTQAPTDPAAPSDAPVVIPKSEGGDDDGLGLGAIIGIAVGGVVVVGIAVVLCYLCNKGRGDNAAAANAGTSGGRNEPPPSELKVKTKQDEISTLDGPGGAATAQQTSNDSVAGYGDQSVATVDYDYSKAYGGGGDTSVSSAGGTFGSNTQGLSTLEAANAAATGAALGGGGSFSDTDSFEAHYRDNNANIKEEFLDIYAPAGKLGVVIDTPDDGAPVVHAVKDSSVIGDKIRVGDKLVAVDDEDVRSMTAIKVSKLISRKSANPSRKLSIIRTTVVE